MKHEEALALAGEWKKGELAGHQAAALRGHLHACSRCRRLVERWAVQPAPEWLEEKVMAGLAGAAPLARSWAGILAPLAGAAALMLLAAFWRPERAWVRADRYFAPAPVLEQGAFWGGGHD